MPDHWHQRFLETIPCPLLVHADGRVLRVNTRAMALFGASSHAELVGTPLRDRLCDPRDVLLLGAPCDAMEIDLRRMDGSRLAVTTSTSLHELGGPPGWMTALKDLAARRSAEDRFFSLALDLLCIVSDDGYFRRINTAFAQALGWTDAEILAKPFLDLVHPDDAESTRREFERQSRGERVLRFENRYRCRDGSYRWLAWGTVLTSDRLMYATAHDLTEAKRAAVVLHEHHAALEQARAEAEQANQAKSAFLAAMSHEIRTPMNGVIGMAEVLSESPMPEDQADAVRTIRDSALALLGVIDHILYFSKIEAGKTELERIPFSLDQIVEGMCTSLATVAARSGVDLSSFVHPSLPDRQIGDPTRLRQVLYNLVGNAIKFSGGRPGIRGRVQVRLELAEAGRLIVSIADNGIGIAPEVMGTLFTPFTQAEASTTRRFGGTGLGLAITARLVRLMGGEIAVRGALAEGSIFSILLPIADAGAVKRTPELSGVSVLLVESAGVPVADLQAWLEHAGARVRVVPERSPAALRRASKPATVRIQAIDCRDSGVENEGREVLLVRSAGLPATGRLSATGPEPGDGSPRVDLDNLRRRALVQAVLVASGRVTPDRPHSPGSAPGSMGLPPSVAEARELGHLILVAEDDPVNRMVILRQLALLGMAAEVAATGAEALALWQGGSFGLLLTDLHMPVMDGYALCEAIRKEEALRDRARAAYGTSGEAGGAGAARNHISG